MLSKDGTGFDKLAFLAKEAAMAHWRMKGVGKMFSFSSYSLIQRAGFLTLMMTIMFSMLPCVRSAEAIERDVAGQWRITAALDGAEVFSLDERGAWRLVGHVFTIGKDQVKFDNSDCGKTEFEEQKVEPERQLREEFHASGKTRTSQPSDGR